MQGQGEVRAQPAPAQGAALLALGAVLAVLGARTDAAGALLAVPGAALAVGAGLRDLLVVPVLQADADGVEVRDGLRRRRLGWPQVARLRVVTDRRALLLEVEAVDGDLLLLSRGRLGRDPHDVLEQLQALRSSGTASG